MCSWGSRPSISNGGMFHGLERAIDQGESLGEMESLVVKEVPAICAIDSTLESWALFDTESSRDGLKSYRGDILW